MRERGTAELHVRTLGCFEVSLHGAHLPDEAWPRRKTRDLMKLLLTQPGNVFTVDQLIDALLPDVVGVRPRIVPQEARCAPLPAPKQRVRGWTTTVNQCLLERHGCQALHCPRNRGNSRRLPWSR